MNTLLFYTRFLAPTFSEKLYRKWLRTFVKNKSFSIISNNCWGGGVYEDLNLPYTSPTVGLFFYAPYYIEFLSQLEYYINHEISFISSSKYPEANQFRAEKNWFYPIGKAGAIEIHFMHYATEEDALQKWRRRSSRIDYNRLFVKMCDRDLCTEENKILFDQLPFQRKVFFTANKTTQSSIFLDTYEGMECVGSLYEEPWNYRKNFNIVKWLNQK